MNLKNLKRFESLINKEVRMNLKNLRVIVR